MPEDIANLLRKELGQCSPAERRVGRVLLADYPAAGLTTVAALASRAGVSAPTVVRFARRFGFDSYIAFRAALQREAEAQREQPAASSAATARAEPSGTCPKNTPELLIDRAGQAIAVGTQETLTSLPPDEVQAAAALLADSSRRLLLGGGRFTRLLAHYLTLHLLQLREGVHLLPEGEIELAALLSRIGRRDVLVLFDYRPYERPTTEIARHAKAAGARLVLFTDRCLSPLSELADVVLPAAVAAPCPHGSLVPSLAVIETLIAKLTVSVSPATDPQHVCV
ncbi:MurR/RpiR family transcriptional regulator [Streptomyces purpurogeneiscleroticus]|uniref:MurR/RpiR family transcriptional regulator n=1 Tax=Streptomyces purpurogeneiscleroticus TaxID=68259 RepID=UPI001CBF4CDE|nr:MurR/RpiR family transcriptional regulator [Streptomyces purpurogeneiscleroticus]